VDAISLDALLVDVLLGLLIGLVLGFLGGGGSILTVPALVYIVGQNPQTAIAASLVIVGSNATLGAFLHRQQGTLNWRIALLFGGVGMVTAYLAAGVSRLVNPTMLLIFFALLMVVVGLFMLRRSQPHAKDENMRGWQTTLLSGAGVGALTGFLGVGGGFLIVPALVMLVGLPMRQAVGTSLIIIAMNSLAGLLGHLRGSSFDTTVITIFVLAGFVGVLGGSRLAKVIRPDHLRASFALFVVFLGLALLVDNMSKLLGT
jgi:uncharacterized protein